MRRYVKKKEYYCRGGPFDGNKIWLSSPSTLPIRFKGVVGRYVRVDSDFMLNNTVKWEIL